VSRRSLQDDGMGAGQNNTITPNKPNRHSEPNVNHGEESHRLVILR